MHVLIKSQPVLCTLKNALTQDAHNIFPLSSTVRINLAVFEGRLPRLQDLLRPGKDQVHVPLQPLYILVRPCIKYHPPSPPGREVIEDWQHEGSILCLVARWTIEGSTLAKHLLIKMEEERKHSHERFDSPRELVLRVLD